MEPSVLGIATASIGMASSYASRSFAAGVMHQGDVTVKSSGTQFEDALISGAFAAAAGYMTRPRPIWAFLPGILVATLTYTAIAEIPALRTSLASPTKPLLVTGGALALGTLMAYGWLWVRMPDQRFVATFGVLLFGAWMSTLWLQRRMDKDRVPKPTVHVHHWMLGLGLIMMFGAFSSGSSIVAGTFVTIGIALIVHAASVYRLTSGVCSYSTNCRAQFRTNQVF
jgi:hypothetical protein